MKKWKKVCLYIFVGLIVLVGLTAFLLNRLADGMCGNKIIKEVKSPNQNNRIIIFVRDCGATTGFSTHASVINSEQSLANEGGNLFSADAAHGKAPSGQGNELIVEVAWQDNNFGNF
ncbi:MAG: hypothetical protein CVU71_04430 [Deltaproteobacteria bacterium HGW-Deltaproteobacteria-6]|jgi:hypothetical protein|nr:MAG: hypothetical protein CVU71_04430 [Deltaproteobacteria bacterium HGW-Deltaproteobacteria-6]